MTNDYLELVSLQKAAAAVIFIWAWFCVFNHRVNDGILGKILFGLLGMAALAVYLSDHVGVWDSTRATIIMNIFVALVGVRHMWMKCLWHHIETLCSRWELCERVKKSMKKIGGDFEKNNS